MRRSIVTGILTVVLAASVQVALAQFPGEGGRGPGGPGGFGGPGGAGGPGGPPSEGGKFGPPPSPLMTALDTDDDGELSAEEIAAAVKSLKKLDKNSDGKLDADELRPQFDGPGGQMGRGGPGGPGGQGGPGGLAQRIMSFDKDSDGKVTREEMPSGMRRMFTRVDTNKDGAIDESEAKAMAEAMESRRPPGQPRTGSR